MNYIYGFVDYGCYEDYNFMFIKINKNDMNLFTRFCRDTRGFGWNDEITLQAWIKDIDIVKKEDYNITIMTIQEYQKNIKTELNILNDMKTKHYLYGKNSYFQKLLNYTFGIVE